MNKIFGNIKPDKDQTKEKTSLKDLNVMKKMLNCFSSYRMMIIISLLRGGGERIVYDIKKDIKEMSSHEPKTIQNACDYLKREGLIKEEGKNIKLTEKGKKLAKIFDLCREVYGDI